LAEDDSSLNSPETVVRKSRYTVIPFLLLIVVAFVGSQIAIEDAPEVVQVTAASAEPAAK
jgi:hypothetical protein